MKIVRVKLIVTDNYLSFHHGLFNGIECDATPSYTSTKRLKGYKIKSAKNDMICYVNVDEVEILGK